MKRLLAALTVALACPFAGAATSWLSVGPITWTLTDLDPSDGITSFFDTSNVMEHEFGTSGPEEFGTVIVDPDGTWRTVGEAIRSAERSVNFTNVSITPRTAITFQMAVHGRATNGGGAYAYIGAAFADSLDSYVEQSFACQANFGESCDNSTTLSVTLSNTGDASRGVSYISGDHQAVVSVNDPALPVPEPETYALMLAGLACVGLAVRRRSVRSGNSK